MTERATFIKKIQIEGFKSIKEAFIELNPINIVIGGNGSGKSNFLSAFDFIRYASKLVPSDYGRANDIFHFGAEHTKRMSFRIESQDCSFETKFKTYETSDEIKRDGPVAYKNSISHFHKWSQDIEDLKVYHFHNTSPKSVVRSHHSVWDNIQLRPNGGNIASILYKIKSYGHNPDEYQKDQDKVWEQYYELKRRLEKQQYKELKLKKEIAEKIEHIKKTDNIESLDVLEFLRDGKESLLRQELDQLQDHRWRTHISIRDLKSNIGRVWGDYDSEREKPVLNKDTKSYIRAYNDIVLSIRAVAPYFDDFVLQKDDNEKVALRWKHNAHDNTVYAPHQLSDGTLRFILLVTLLLQPNPPKIVIIDEPELGLHPKALGVLAEIIQVVSQKTQVILTTQSVEFANLFEPEDFIVVDYENGESRFTRPNAQELELWLEDYGMGDIWCKNLIGGRL